MVVRTGSQAIAWAETQHVGWNGACLGFTRSAFNLPAVYGRAIDAWDATVAKHKTTNPNSIPAGVPVFMQGRNPAGHVALSLGGGRFYSTNDLAGGPGPYSIQSWINVGYRLLGWAEDVNDVYVYGSRAGRSTRAVIDPPTPAVSKEDADMKYKGTTTNQKQAVKSGMWKGLRIADGAVYTITSSPHEYINSHVDLRITGLPVGAVLQARFAVFDKAKGEYVTNYPIQEIVGTSGDTFGSLDVNVTVGTAGRLLRVRFTGPDGATIVSASARTGYSA